MVRRGTVVSLVRSSSDLARLLLCPGRGTTHFSYAFFAVVAGAAVALTAASVGMFAPEARARSGLAAGNNFGVVAEVPANGQLIGDYACQWRTTCGFPPAMDVFDSSGQAVAGELTISAAPDRTSAIYTFRPAQPWTLGAVYTVTDLATAPGGPSASAFTVMPAVTPEAGRIATDLVLAEKRSTLREVCCDESRDSCGDPYCVALESEIALDILMHVTPPADSRRQWLSRPHAVDMGAERTTTAVAEVVSPWGYPSLRIIEQRSSYCVQIELSSLEPEDFVQRSDDDVEPGGGCSLPRSSHPAHARRRRRDCSDLASARTD